MNPDPHYRLLIKTLGRRIRDWVEVHGGTIVQGATIQSSGNSVWGVVRLHGADEPVWLFHAVSDTEPDLHEPGQEGTIKVDKVPVRPELLEALTALVQSAELDTWACPECGHQMIPGPPPIPGPVGICPGCGHVEAEPGFPRWGGWEEADD